MFATYYMNCDRDFGGNVILANAPEGTMFKIVTSHVDDDFLIECILASEVYGGIPWVDYTNPDNPRYGIAKYAIKASVN